MSLSDYFHCANEQARSVMTRRRVTRYYGQHKYVRRDVKTEFEQNIIRGRLKLKLARINSEGESKTIYCDTEFVKPIVESSERA